MSRRLAMVWEVLARIGAEPARAVTYMARYQGLAVTETEAARQLAAAESRNDLRLVTAREIASHWAHRVRPRG